jgi:hypothetical protein
MSGRFFHSNSELKLMTLFTFCKRSATIPLHVAGSTESTKETIIPENNTCIMFPAAMQFTENVTTDDIEQDVLQTFQSVITQSRSKHAL